MLFLPSVHSTGEKVNYSCCILCFMHCNLPFAPSGGKVVNYPCICIPDLQWFLHRYLPASPSSGEVINYPCDGNISCAAIYLLHHLVVRLWTILKISNAFYGAIHFPFLWWWYCELS